MSAPSCVLMRVAPEGRAPAPLNPHNPPTCVPRNEQKYLRITFLLFIALLSGSVVSYAQGAGHPPAVEVSALVERAAVGERIPVIVTLEIPWQAEGRLPDRAAVTAQRKAIRKAQERVLNALGAAETSGLKRFRFGPQLALTVGSVGLARILAHPLVRSVAEDAVSRPFLAESTPLIGAGVAQAGNITGAGTVVAVLDTGVENDHPFFGGRVISDYEACFSTSSPQNSATSLCPNGLDTQYGLGAAAPCGETEDTIRSSCGHGTHVAGIVAGREVALSEGASTKTYVGVAPNAEIMALQVFSRLESEQACGAAGSCVLSFTSDQISALEFVLEQAESGVNVVAANMSLGGGPHSNTPCDMNPRKPAIDNLISVGVATVIAAGNDSKTDGISQPACISSAISVGATTDAALIFSGKVSPVDTVAPFSNSGSPLDLLAPGTVVRSSIPSYNGSGTYGFKQGTSMAAPAVAGAIALLREKAPSASVSEVENALVTTGVTILDGRNGLTRPRIQVDAALGVIGGNSDAALGVSAGSTSEQLRSANFAGPVGGPFLPQSWKYTLTNNGSFDALDFEVGEETAWAEVSPASGTIAPGASRVVTVSLNSTVMTLSAGFYGSTLRFNNISNGNGSQTVELQLQINAPAAANDKFVEGLVITNPTGSLEGSNAGASKETGEPDHRDAGGGRSVWWRWLAPVDGEMTASVEQSEFNAVLAAYTGATVDGLTEAPCAADSCGDNVVSFEVTAGTLYHLAVDGRAGETGDIVLNLAFEEAIVALPELVVLPAQTYAASGTVGGPFSPPTQSYTLENLGSIPQPFSVSDLPVWITAVPESGEVVGNGSVDVVMTVNAAARALTAGHYEATVNLASSSRLVTLDISRPPPANDVFEDSLSIQADLPQKVTGGNFAASKEQGEPAHAGKAGGRSVWWHWKAPDPAPALVEINSFGSSFDTLLAVYTGVSVSNLSAVVSSDDGGTDADNRLQSRVTFAPVAGQAYRIAVDGLNGAEGNITLQLQAATLPAPANDDFLNAVPLSGPLPLSDAVGTSVGASREVGEPLHAGDSGGASVWWTWTPQDSAVVTVSTAGSGFDTLLAVYTGQSVSQLTPVAENNDDSGSPQSAVSFQATGGQAYHIAVDGLSGAAGAITLTIDAAPVVTRVLSVALSGEGSVVSTPVGVDCPTDCQAQFENGAEIVLIAQPASGWQLESWSGACSASGSCRLVMAADRSVSAHFSPLPVLSVETSGSGSVSSAPVGISCPADECSFALAPGSAVVLTAAAAPGSVFASWGGACLGQSGETCSLVLQTDTVVSATFLETIAADFSVLLVDDDHDRPDVQSYFTAVLDRLGIAYNVWDTRSSDNEPEFENLMAADAVVWFTGGAYAPTTGPGPESEGALADYLEAGGCFVLSAQDYHSVRGLTPFMRRYLGLYAVDDDVYRPAVSAEAGSLVGAFDDTLAFVSPEQNFGDALQPGANATPLIAWSDGSTAGLHHDAGLYQATFLAYPAEAMTESVREQVIEKLLGSCAAAGDAVDTDGDGLSDDWERARGLNPELKDSDGDEVEDGIDAFPLDPEETTDTDGDGIGDNADPDDDNDGVVDDLDQFPRDPGETVDTDLDGVGNNLDPDDDGDGVEDSRDHFPLDPAEWADTDGDGLANNADPDDDNDGLPDIADWFPYTPIGSFPDGDGDGAPDLCDESCLATGMGADPDVDADGMPDAWEARYPGVAEHSPYSEQDLDEDTLVDRLEYELGSLPDDAADLPVGRVYQQQKTFSPDVIDSGLFGYEVVIEGDKAVVAAPSQSDESQDSNPTEGAVYVFEREGVRWRLRQKLPNPQPERSYRFGDALALAEGLLVVGSPYESVNGVSSGAAWVYQQDAEGVWYPIQRLVPETPLAYQSFGEALAIDGEVIAVGGSASAYSYTDGAIFLFRSLEGRWRQVEVITPPEAYDDVGIGLGRFFAFAGGQIFAGLERSCGYIGDCESGSGYPAWVFGAGDGEDWSLQQALNPGELPAESSFGYAYAAEGETLLVGAPGEGNYAGAVYRFERGAEGWQYAERLVTTDAAAGDVFGSDIALSGNRMAVSAYGDDYFEPILVPRSCYQGEQEPCFSPDEDNTGSVYLFQRFDDGHWAPNAKLTPRDRDQVAPEFRYAYWGGALDLDGGSLIVGGPRNGDSGGESGPYSGSAYFYDLDSAGLYASSGKKSGAGAETLYAVALPAGALVPIAQVEQANGLPSIDFTVDGRLWAVTGKSAIDGKQHILELDRHTGEVLFTSGALAGGEVQEIAVHPVSREMFGTRQRIVSYNPLVIETDFLRIEPESAAIEVLGVTDCDRGALTFYPDGRLLCAGKNIPGLYELDPDTGEILSQLPLESGYMGLGRVMNDALWGIAGGMFLLDPQSGTETSLFSVSGALHDVAYFPDRDSDGFADWGDAFPDNPSETVDFDDDGQGDNADPDDDNDGVEDISDNCLFLSNPGQENLDEDDAGDACDDDIDGDGVLNYLDALPEDATETIDSDDDGTGDNADTDDDNDGVPDVSDNCRLVPNASQTNSDTDVLGDACDTDDDNDGVPDSQDAFRTDPNESVDTDGDGIGNKEDDDDDGDGFLDVDEIAAGSDPFNRRSTPDRPRVGIPPGVLNLLLD